MVWSKKNVLIFFGILTPGDLNFGLSKNDGNYFEMIFRELSNSAFRFSLRRPGAEIMEGVQTPPPPQQAVENPEAQQAAG